MSIIPDGWTLKQARLHLERENRKWPDVLCPVAQSEWPTNPGLQLPLAVWRSRRFMVAAYRERDTAGIRLSVNRAELKPGAINGDWLDGISWDDLQRIKRECGYGDRQAIEIYPPDYEIVNVGNMRHLWILDSPINAGWRGKERER